MTCDDDITESFESLEGWCSSKVDISHRDLDLSHRELVGDLAATYLQACTVSAWGAQKMLRIWNNRRQRDGHTGSSDDSFVRTSSIEH